MGRAVKTEQEQAPTSTGGRDQGMTILSYLIAGIALYGGLGWLADNHFGTRLWLPIGLVTGMAVSLYVIIKRYGSGA